MERANPTALHANRSDMLNVVVSMSTARRFGSWAQNFPLATSRSASFSSSASSCAMRLCAAASSSASMLGLDLGQLLSGLARKSVGGRLQAARGWIGLCSGSWVSSLVSRSFRSVVVNFHLNGRAVWL